MAERASFFLFLSIFCIFPFQLQSKIILFNYHPNQYSSDLRIKASLGTPFKEYTLTIDLCSQYTILSTNAQLLTSSSYRNHDTVVKQGLFNGMLSSDIIMLDNDLTLNELPYLRYTPSFSGVQIAYLGLGRGSHSLPSLLHQAGLINRNVFQIEREGLFIGGFNSTLNTNEALQSCDLIKNHEYNCLMHQLNFIRHYNDGTSSVGTYSLAGKTEIGVNHAVFKANYENISAPFLFWDFFQINYFKDHLLKEQCKELKGMYAISVKCFSNSIELLPDIKFVFDNAELVLKPQELFDRSFIDIYDMVLFRIDFMNDLSYWLIGTYLIQKYRMIFNNEDGVLQFVADSNIINKEDNSSEINERETIPAIQRILIGMSCLLIYGIAMNAIGLRKSKGR